MTLAQNEGQQKASLRSGIFAFLLVLLTGCDLKSLRSPSILVIAVEGLGFSRQTCGETTEKGEINGFALICQEAFRFTHAFTTSPSSQAAMASLLTGLSPVQTGITHNGPQYLSEEIETVAEFALKMGYRTSFFSGGAPIFHRSGLGQGFEVFEDSLAKSQAYRSSSENFVAFKRWIEQLSPKSPFFSVIFMNDFLFNESVSTSLSGDILPLSKAGKQKQMSEVLFEIRNFLKLKKMWESTWVIVVGLNGHHSNLDTLNQQPLHPSDLSSKATQVTLLIKSPSRRTDEGKEQPIDTRISIQDLGFTFFSLMRTREARTEKNSLLDERETLDLVKIIEEQKKPTVDDRILIQLDGWALWRNMGPMRAAARQGQYLLVHHAKPQLFNTLIDRFETNPIPRGDPLWRSVGLRLELELENLGFDLSGSIDQSLFEATQFSRNLLDFFETNDPEIRAKTYSWLKTHTGEDRLKMSWLSFLALREKKWEDLLFFGKKLKNAPMVYLAIKHLNRTSKIDLNGCEIALQWKKKDYRRMSIQECDDAHFRNVLEWALDQNGDPSSKLLDEYAIFMGQVIWQDWLSKKNASLGFIFDVPLEIPQRPTISELFLEMPQNMRLKRIVNQRILLKNPNLSFYSSLYL